LSDGALIDWTAMQKQSSEILKQQNVYADGVTLEIRTLKGEDYDPSKI
jgi:hypothetical protein